MDTSQTTDVMSNPIGLNKKISSKVEIDYPDFSTLPVMEIAGS